MSERGGYRRRSGGARPAQSALEPATGRRDRDKGGSGGEARLQRLRRRPRSRVPEKGSGDLDEPGDPAAIADSGRAVGSKASQSQTGACVASAAQLPGRTDSVGYQHPCMAGGSGRGERGEDVPDRADRRCDQHAVCALRGGRLDRASHAGVVGYSDGYGRPQSVCADKAGLFQPGLAPGWMQNHRHRAGFGSVCRFVLRGTRKPPARQDRI